MELVAQVWVVGWQEPCLREKLVVVGENALEALEVLGEIILDWTQNFLSVFDIEDNGLAIAKPRFFVKVLSDYHQSFVEKLENEKKPAETFP